MKCSQQCEKLGAKLFSQDELLHSEPVTLSTGAGTVAGWTGKTDHEPVTLSALPAARRFGPRTQADGLG